MIEPLVSDAAYLADHSITVRTNLLPHAPDHVGSAPNGLLTQDWM